MVFKLVRRKQNVSVVHLHWNARHELPVLLTADRHWDNPMSNWDLQQKHLEQAEKLHAPVFDFGDFFCAMQGKYDKRASKSTLRPEHQNDNYFDSLIDTATEFFKPWASSICMIGEGNHETKIRKNHETDLISRLCKNLKFHGSQVYNGGYSGWIIFALHDKDKVEYKRMWYIHGYGGGGPVTKGMIQTNRRANYIDADIFVTGHIHESWTLDIPRIKHENDRVIHYEQTHIQLPTYKDEYADGFGGWHVETGKPLKPIGATWLFFRKEGRGAPVVIDTQKAR